MDNLSNCFKYVSISNRHNINTMHAMKYFRNVF